MISNCTFLKKVIFLLIVFSEINSFAAERVEILMSNVTTQKEDAYMCTSYKLSDDQRFITNIEPLTTADIAHHMFAFGCDKPASQSKSWNCGSFVCQGSKTILFAWGRNAAALKMPDDVAFKVGPETSYKYIVVNIHYLKKVENDASGLALQISNKARTYQAGIMLLVSGYIAIPAKTKQYSSDFSCKYTGKNLNVFAFRVHAHAHGEVNSAYRVRNHEWVQLARGDPQWPQAFYPTDDLYDLKDGDALIGRCSYRNEENRIVYAGSTHNDEMCNVYLMYYTDDTKDVMDTCSGNTYPQLESILPAESIQKPLKPSTFISKYTFAENWYDQKSIGLGQVGGIAINQKSENIVIFHRGSQVWQADSFNGEYNFNTRKYSTIKSDTIVVLNRNTGKLVQSWGSDMFYMPHGLTVDNDGNVWVTDVGRHQVLKFSANNLKEPVLQVGELLVPGNDKNHFCQPADVAVLRNGDFFVADGYCNSRIVKFDKNGQYLTEWSSEDEKMPSHFFIPHSLALHEQQNLLCVADRENLRIQCFDLNGNNIVQINSEFGPIYGVAFASNNATTLFAVNGYNSRSETQFEKKVFLFDVQTGNTIGAINLNNDAMTPHDIAVSYDSSEIYVADLNPSAVFKYVLVNYKIGQDPKRKNGNSSKVLQTDKLNIKDENFRTSIFIMAFLAIPLVLVVITALIVRLKNSGKLRDVSLKNVGNGLETKHKELGKWISKTSNRKKRNNGFTRLNQDSEEEEAESLNKNSNMNDSDSDSAEDEIHLPNISKV